MRWPRWRRGPRRPSGRSALRRPAEHESEIADKLRVFDEICVKIQSRRNQALSDLRQERDRFREELTGSLLHQLDRTNDPRGWLETELTYQLERQLSAWDGNVRRVLHDTTSRHLDAVVDTLENTFGMRPEQPASPRSEGPAMPAMDGVRLADLRQRKLLYRMGPTGVALLAAVLIPGFGPPAALIASLVGTGLAEIRLRTLVDEQRTMLKKRLPGLVDAAIDPYTDTIADHLGALYRHMEDEVLRLRRQWRTAAPTLPVAPTSDAPDWSSIAVAPEELLRKILAGAEAAAEVAGPAIQKGAH